MLCHVETRSNVERSVWVNTTAEAETFLQNHPDYNLRSQNSEVSFDIYLIE